MSKLDNLKWRKTYIKESKRDAKATRPASSSDKPAEANPVVPVVSQLEDDTARDTDANGNIA
jgi:hypothetical protein